MRERAQVRQEAWVLRSFVSLICLMPTLALSWGFDGHRKLASVMHEPLPANGCLRQWLQNHQTYALQNSACDPDRWRTGPDADPLEAPRHYLEIDYEQPIASYPRDYADVEARFGQYAAKNGQVPWRVEALYFQLVAAFRAKDEAEILRLMFVLSHYVTDAHSVLHDSKNFDPNKGLHARWESDMLDSTSNLNAIYAQAATLYGTPGIADPRNNIFDQVITGNGLLGQLISADKIASGDGGVYNSTTYQLKTLFQLTKDLTARRWADALTVLSSLLWTAWAQAGRPELTGFSTDCSRAMPSGEIVLRGFATVFTHPGDSGIVFPPDDAGITVDAGSVDAGSVDAGAVDAGAVDAGAVDAGPNQEPDGGGTGGGEGTGGGGGTEEKPAGCSCAHLDLSMLGFGAWWLAFSRRRRA